MTFPMVILAGAGLGCGLLLLVASLRRPVPGVEEALQRMSLPATPLQPGGRPSAAVALARAMGLEHLLTSAVRRDLAVLQRPPDDHLTRCLLYGAGLGLVPPLAAGVAAVTGVGVNFLVPTGLTLALAAAGAVLPSLSLHQQAERRRADFRHALSAYLNLVGVNVAAGSGVEGALHAAAGCGQGPAYGAIRQALTRAQVTGRTPWSALETLGAEIGVDELGELAAAIALAGGAGARVRESLAAKATTMRKRGLSDIQAAANSVTERMAMPVVLLVIGLIVFIGYPAIFRILNGL